MEWGGVEVLANLGRRPSEVLVGEQSQVVVIWEEEAAVVGSFCTQCQHSRRMRMLRFILSAYTGLSYRSVVCSSTFALGWGKALSRPWVLGIGVVDTAMLKSIIHIHPGIYLLPTIWKCVLPSKQVNMCLKSLLTMEMHIYAIIRHYYVPPQWPKMKNQQAKGIENQYQVLPRIWSKRILMNSLWKCGMIPYMYPITQKLYP